VNSRQIHIFTTIVAISLSMACSQRRSAVDAADVFRQRGVVAVVRGTDSSTQAIIREVLGKKRIPVLWEGSIAYAVVVPKHQLDKARESLARDGRLTNERPRVNSSHITFGKSGNLLIVAQWQDRYALSAPEPGIISPGEATNAERFIVMIGTGNIFANCWLKWSSGSGCVCTLTS
jgi:hypothetical protein